MAQRSASVSAMTEVTDTLDLRRLQLLSGEGRRFDLAVHLEPFAFGDDEYPVTPDPIGVRVDLSKMAHNGHALRLRFGATLHGPCMRCLAEAHLTVEVDAREVDQPDGGEELDSPYVDDEDVLDLAGWSREALALALPAQVLCRPDCKGLCAECGINLNDAPDDHHHERAPDPRWAALADLKLE